MDIALFLFFNLVIGFQFLVIKRLKAEIKKLNNEKISQYYQIQQLRLFGNTIRRY